MNYQENMYTARRGRAADFRKRAKKALKGFWLIAALVTLLASLVGAVGASSTGSVSFTAGETEVPVFSDAEIASLEQAIADFDFQAIGDIISKEYPVLGFALSFFVTIAIVTVILGIAIQLFVTSPVKVGYQKFCLNVLDGRESGITIGTLVEFFKHGYFKTIGLNIVHRLIMHLTALPLYICMLIGGISLVGSISALLSNDPSTAIASMILFVVLTFLGSILSLCISIPVTYMYSMAHVIMADYPDVGVIEAMRLSRQMMKGNKFRLFCLDFSFIGWEFLALCCTCGIGMYFLIPYQQVSRAAFYEEISNRTVPYDVEFPSINPADYIIE